MRTVHKSLCAIQTNTARISIFTSQHLLTFHLF